jgi:hypothetical protein|tara:strand:+ start:160 stop:453 length:294 start_codon:yes stop_codon:yes gene_type:complete
MIDSIENLINDVVNALYADPIYLVLGVIISGLLIFSLVKKLIRIAMYLSAVAILYIGYLYFTGAPVESVVDGASKLIEDGKQVIEKKMNDFNPSQGQ